MIEVFDVEQRSPDWFALRAGIPTSSEFKTILAKGEGKTRRTYMHKLAGERITGEPMENYTNWHMERGRAMEVEARDFYVMMTDSELQQIGFIRSGNVGASPDALIGENGLLEIKTALPHLLIDLILKDEFPAEHMAQCQGQLWVSGREWVDLIVYWRKMPPFIKRVHRNREWLTKIASEVHRFNDELDALVERIKSYGRKEAA